MDRLEEDLAATEEDLTRVQLEATAAAAATEEAERIRQEQYEAERYARAVEEERARQ